MKVWVSEAVSIAGLYFYTILSKFQGKSVKKMKRHGKVGKRGREKTEKK